MIKKDLFDTNASLYVLSCLMREPLLLQRDEYVLNKTDFFKPLQQMIFYAIFNLAQSGAEKIVPADIDLLLKQYDSQYEFYKANKGYEFVTQCYQTTEGSDLKQFKTYYDRVKKFALLRDLEAAGYDTKQFYDTDQIALNRDLEDDKLNKLKITDITNKIRSDIVDIENKHIGKDDSTSQNAAKGLAALVEELKQNPEVGLPLDGSIINYAARGARLGKLYTYSAPSGAGKTRYMVGNACAISMPYIDKKTNQLIIRGTEDHYDYQKVLFITTEQQVDEIQTMILAYVANVNERAILLGNYTTEEEKRIDMALKIIEIFKDNFIIETIPDPSIAMIKARLVKYIIQDNVEYIFYDYIFSSPGLLGEFRDIGVREDVALMMLSNTLKEIAAVYNVFIQSATQLNEGWSKRTTGLRDQNCIRGSKAIADKIDMGMIGIRIPEEEKQQIDTLWTKLYHERPDAFEHSYPNIVVDIYKNRRGELNAVKVFRYFDYGTLHAEDLFITDASYKGISDIGGLEYDNFRTSLDFIMVGDC